MANIDPTFSDISPSTTSTPTVAEWFTSQTQEAPDVLAPYLAAHGFKPIGGTPYYADGEFAGWMVNMHRTRFQHAEATQDMLLRMTEAYNEGRIHNDRRYEDLISNLDDLISKAQTHMDNAKTSLDAKLTIHLTTLDNLENDYDTFFTAIKTELDDLTANLDARRNSAIEDYNARLSESDQGLTNRGYYSSALITSADAGIATEHQKVLTEITEAEQRLQAEILLRKNEIYVNVLRMRAGLVQSQMELTNREQQFLAYQLDTRNNLALAMFGFVERREDSYPGLGDMAALVTGLGDDS